MLENNQKELIFLSNLGFLYPNEKSKQKRNYAIYKCFCGNEFKTISHSVKTKQTKSCGCLKDKHKSRDNRIFTIWKSMIQRCNNPQNPRYKDYGARGITVCDEWLNSENFINDMFPSFQEGLSLDRENNNLGYSKQNCRWVSKNTQNRNTRLLRRSNTSGYRGVVKNGNNYQAQIVIDYKNIYLGTYKTKLEAAKAYDDYVLNNNLEHTRNFS